MVRPNDVPRCPDCGEDLQDAEDAAHEYELKAMQFPPNDPEGSHRYNIQVANAIRKHDFYCEDCDSGVDAEDATPPGSQTTLSELAANGGSR